MNIKQLLSIIADYCIYYYKRYHYILRNKNINIPIHIKRLLMTQIYNYYTNTANTEYVYDIYLLEQPYDKIFILDKDTISIGDMLEVIDNYIDRTKSLITLTSDINILSLSKHPLENYVTIDYNWIKQIIDIYLY